MVTTKRVVFSVLARLGLIDLLGLLVPFAMVAKCLFQSLWHLALQWDEAVPSAIHQDFIQWRTELDSLRSWEFPIVYLFPGLNWNL